MMVNVFRWAGLPIVSTQGGDDGLSNSLADASVRCGSGLAQRGASQARLLLTNFGLNERYTSVVLEALTHPSYKTVYCCPIG